MAINADQCSDIPGGAAALYVRLPIQALLVAWAYAAGKD
jgi:uncharacterized membrane protein